MLHPTIEELTNKDFNRYEIALATAKCARLINDEYVVQRDAAEKAIAGSKDADRSVISFMRMANDQKLIVLCNFAPLKWSGYQVPLPEDGEVSVVFSSDAKNFGGSGDALNVKKCDHPVADMPYGFSIDLPAFSTIILAYN